MHPALVSLGWTADLEDAFQPYTEDQPARVSVEHRGAYVVMTQDGDMWAEASGRLRHDAEDRSEMPAVGDWVALRVTEGAHRASITAVLPRRTAFIRKEAGFVTGGQVLAANADHVWIVAAMTKGLSARRIERFLTVAWDSGAQPMVVFTKSDIGDIEDERIAEVERIAVGAPIIVTSAVTGEGLAEVVASLEGNKTAALLGASGVGKSTLINRLVGEDLLEVRPTDAAAIGRHTTVRRELVVVPSCGMLSDTPGLRELIGWDDSEGVDTVYADIEALMSECRFVDCAHRTEPGCAVRAAIAQGTLDPSRLASYQKMQRELSYVERRRDGKAALNAKKKFKAITTNARARRRAEIDR